MNYKQEKKYIIFSGVCKLWRVKVKQQCEAGLGSLEDYVTSYNTISDHSACDWYGVERKTALRNIDGLFPLTDTWNHMDKNFNARRVEGAYLAI